MYADTVKQCGRVQLHVRERKEEELKSWKRNEERTIKVRRKRMGKAREKISGQRMVKKRRENMNEGRKIERKVCNLPFDEQDCLELEEVSNELVTRLINTKEQSRCKLNTFTEAKPRKENMQMVD
jgi:hypothetical protein